MKKALSVILAMIFTFSVLVVGVNAGKVAGNVFNFSYKSGDIVDLTSYKNKLNPNGGPIHTSLEFNADTTEPISGGTKTISDDYTLYTGFSAYSAYAESISFSGIGPILVENRYAFGDNPVNELYVPFNIYSYDYYIDDCYEDALLYSISTGKPVASGYASYLFGNCLNLETVTIDNYSDKLFKWAFYNCTSLINVYFTDKVTKISTGMFERCTSLESIEIPSTIKTIGECAFYNTGLNSITIPSTVTSIEPYALGYQGNNTVPANGAFFNYNGYGTDAASINRYPKKYGISKVEGFKIYGEAGSEAERYANENGFEFIETEGQTEKAVYSACAAKQAALGENAEINVSVSSGADKIQLINSDNKTITYTRDSANVKSIETVSDSKETWTLYLKTYKPTETYNVKAKFGKMWVTGDNIQFTLDELQLLEKTVYSAKVDIPGLKGNYAYVDVIAGGSPIKIQLRDSSGSTITYNRDNPNVVSIKTDEVLHIETWRIKLRVYKSTEDYTVYAKYNNGWSDKTSTFTLDKIVKSQSELNLCMVNYGDENYPERYLIIIVNSGTKRIASGNVYDEEDIGCTVARTEYAHLIGAYETGREKWEIPYGLYHSLLNFSGALNYISAEMADGSWVTEGYRIREEYNGYGYDIYIDTVEPGSVKRVYSAEVISQSGKYVDVKVNVTAGASKIQFINNKGETLTYTPLNTAVKSIEQSGDNEIWTISLYTYRPTDTYTVNAKYGREWKTGSGVQFTVNEQ